MMVFLSGCPVVEVPCRVPSDLFVPVSCVVLVGCLCVAWSRLVWSACVFLFLGQGCLGPWWSW